MEEAGVKNGELNVENRGHLILKISFVLLFFLVL